MNEDIKDDTLAEYFIESLNKSKKYKDIEICPETLRDIINVEKKKYKKRTDIIKSAKKKIHEVMALYLGDPDYDIATEKLKEAFNSGEDENIKRTCLEILSSHISTRERIDILDTFYKTIFDFTGKPESIIDLACGLNPLTFPWMGLQPLSTKYYAYDIRTDRINFIKDYFELQCLSGLALTRDILVNPPQIKADIAFIFKEVHRFEQRHKGTTLNLLNNLKVKNIVISLPKTGIHKNKDLTDYSKNIFYKVIDKNSNNWEIKESTIGNEILFFIKK